MKITLLADEAIRLEPVAGPMTIEAPSAERSTRPSTCSRAGSRCARSPSCSHGRRTRSPADDLVIDVSWTFAENPHRVGDIAVTFDWPSLPAEPPRRRAQGRRAVHRAQDASPSTARHHRAVDAAWPSTRNRHRSQRERGVTVPVVRFTIAGPSRRRRRAEPGARVHRRVRWRLQGVSRGSRRC